MDNVESFLMKKGMQNNTVRQAMERQMFGDQATQWIEDARGLVQGVLPQDEKKQEAHGLVNSAMDVLNDVKGKKAVQDDEGAASSVQQWCNTASRWLQQQPEDTRAPASTVVQQLQTALQSALDGRA